MTVDLLAGAVERAVEVELKRVPEPVLRHAGHIVADTVAVIVAGAREPEIRNLVRLQQAAGLVAPARGGAAGGSHASTILAGPPAATFAANAAFINATAGTFLELDEGMRPTGHPAIHVLPAALAVAEERHSRGEDLLRALLAGYEVTSRLFRAFRLRYPVHPHGHFGAIGAAVACAVLLDADPLAAARIAATTPLLPVWQACFDGATARNTFTGHAAEAGVRSCHLAEAGFTGSPSALEVAFGEVGGELVDPSVLTADLAYDDLAVSRNYFKRHSACALSHAAIEAVLEMELPPVDDVRTITVETVAANQKLGRQPRPNSLSGRFSLPYAVATAVLLGRTDPQAFTYRPEVAELARLVTVEEAADLEELWPRAAPARVTVRSGGGTVVNTVMNAYGHHSRPFDDLDVRHKFHALLAAETVAGAWWPRLTSLTDVDDCARLFEGPTG